MTTTPSSQQVREVTPVGMEEPKETVGSVLWDLFWMPHLTQTLWWLIKAPFRLVKAIASAVLDW